MLLAIDAGNTHVVFGVYEAERLEASWRVSTPPTWTGDEVAMLLRDLFALRNVDLGKVDGVVIGSVVPNLNQGLLEAAETHLKVAPVMVGPGVKTGVRILYENPKEVGADRIANSLAAFRKFGGPVIVIDLLRRARNQVVWKMGQPE